MREFLTFAVLIIMVLSLVACGTTGGAILSGVSIAGRILRGVTGTETERDTLCQYYKEHRAEVEAVREYAKATWERVPEEYKPALLAINDRLNACDEPTTATADDQKTTARALLDALRRAVDFYGKLKSAGVV